MSFCQDIRHLFCKKSTPPLGSGDGDPSAERKLSVAAGHAAVYLEGLMKAPEGDRNLEDMAQCVEGGDHQRLHHFASSSPWSHGDVTAWVSQQADGILGGHPDSHLIIDESAFGKKGKDSVGVARQYNGNLGKVDN